MANAAVTATNIATGEEIARKTTEAGVFVLPLLTPGEYTVTIKANGFQTLTQAKVIVEALATVGMNAKLQIGAANQSVTVSDQPTILKTDDVALGSSVDNRVFDALPLAMNGAARDPSAFAGLAIGVNTYSTQAAGPSTGSLNGGQTYQNEVYIFSVGVSRLFIPLTSNTASGNYPSKAGLTGLPPGIASTGFPDITFSGNNAPVSWEIAR